MISLVMTVTDERRAYDAYIEQCMALEENANIKFSIKECIVYWNDNPEATGQEVFDGIYLLQITS